MLQTHCNKKLHKLAGDNLVFNSEGFRACRLCRSEREKAWKRATRLAVKYAKLTPQQKIWFQRTLLRLEAKNAVCLSATNAHS